MTSVQVFFAEVDFGGHDGPDPTASASCKRRVRSRNLLGDGQTTDVQHVYHPRLTAAFSRMHSDPQPSLH